MLHLQVQYSQQKCGLHGYWEHPTIHDLGKEKVYATHTCIGHQPLPPPVPGQTGLSLTRNRISPHNPTRKLPQHRTSIG